MRQILRITLPLLMMTVVVAEEPPALVKPIVPLTKVEPKPKAFEDSSHQKPLVLKSEKDGSIYFMPAELKKLKSKVDFKKQIVLVFAWKGSGQDKLTFEVAESYPEQIQFKYRPGRTKDLRPHVKIYALRSNVKWSVKDISRQ